MAVISSQENAMHPSEQTIFALSSGRLPAAIAIVRISGPQSASVLTLLCGRVPTARLATRCMLKSQAGEPIDDAMVLWFPGPASATGEDVAELHIHGSRAVLAALIAELSTIEHLRPAEPGEFTRRAFENGKIDLTGAEALDDLIHADTDQQRRQALRQLQGLLGDRARAWRQQIIEASALIEASIDFSDEGDVPDELQAPAFAKIAALAAEISEVLAAQHHGERLRDGLVVAIVGRPNVGKSTLINQLARREVAIVSPHAGTTRDIIEVHLDLGGYPVTVIDTAGIRDTLDPVEQEGVRRAQARAADADLVLWLADDDAESPPMIGSDQVVLWRVRNKIDLKLEGGDAADRSVSAVSQDFAISAKQGEGVSALVSAIGEFAAEYFGAGETSLISRQRHRDLLQQALQMLQCSIADRDRGEELVAEDLRAASRALGRLLGQIDVEDLLDVIFSEFCIGK
jgi:tRNA modification GTPase